MIFNKKNVESFFSSFKTSVKKDVIVPLKEAESLINTFNNQKVSGTLSKEDLQTFTKNADETLGGIFSRANGEVSLEGYNFLLEGSATGIQRVSEAIKEYNTLSAKGIDEQTKFARTISTSNATFGNYLVNLNGSKASLAGYGVSLVADTAKTIGLTVATTALNAALSMGASVLVSLVISAISGAISSVKSLSERAEEAKEKIEEIESEFKEHSETVNSVKDRYAELAQSVKDLGKATQSQGSLSTDEYEEFLDLSNQLAEVYPQLTAHYDENGNSILNLSGSVDTITDSLNNLLEVEERAANQKILDEFPDVFEEAMNNISDAEDKLDDVQKKFDTISKVYGQLSNGSVTQAFGTNQQGYFYNGEGEKVSILLSDYKATLDKMGVEYTQKSIINNGQLQGYIINTTTGVTAKATEVLDNARQDIKAAKLALEEETSSLNSYYNTWLNSEYSYSTITDPNLKSAVQDMVLNLNWRDYLPDNIDKTNSEEVGQYLKENILYAINNIQDDADITNALTQVYSNAEISPTEKQEFLQKLQDYFGEDSLIYKVYIKPEIDENNEVKTEYDNAIKDFKEQFGEDFNIEGLLKDNSINDSTEIALFDDVLEQAKNAGWSVDEFVEELKKKLKEAQTVADESSLKSSNMFDLGDSDTPTALGKIYNQIDDIQNAYSTLTDAIAEYNSNGSFSIDTMQSIISLGDDWLDYLVDENGNLQLDEQSLKNLTQARIEDMKQQTIQSMIDTVKNINTEAGLNNYLASTNYDLANSYKAVTKAELETAKAHLQTLVDSGEITTEKYNEAIQKLESNIEKVSLIYDSTDWNIGSDGSSSTALSTLENHASLLKDVQDEYSELGKLSSDTLSSIASAYSGMDTYVTKYRMGLMSEEELFAKLQECYQADVENYTKAIALKMQKDEDFTQQLYENYPELYNKLQDIYGDDLKNFKNLEKLKLALDKRLTGQILQNWGTYMRVAQSALTGSYEVQYETSSSSRYTSDDSGAMEHEENEATSTLKQEAKEAQEQADALNQLLDYNQELIDEIDNASLDLAKVDLGDLSWETLSSSLDDVSDSASDTSEEMDWLERAIKKVERAYNRLKDVSSDTTRSWATRNAAVSQSMEELTKEIELQTQAYEYYMQLFNALDLDDYYKQLIMDGAMFTETITDPDLLEVINKAIELFDKAQDAQDSISSMTAELHELSTEIFDNTAKEYEQMLNVYEHAMTTLENGVSLIETKGYKVTANLYEAMISQTEDQLAYLQEERAALEEAMNSADVEAGSEAWMDMYNQILDVDNAIQEATISLAEFNNELRQLKWDKFDDIQSGIQETIDEADFLYELMSNKTLFNDDGSLTDVGRASQGLLAEKYDLYMAMADRYAEAVKEIDAELASDPNNTILLERRQELLAAQREAILSAEDEKQAIADLIEDSYSKLGDTISDLIDKYKDFMDTIKDTYDYEKEMAEKTAELADLQKQYAAIRNDDSEEGMTRRQQLEDQIKDSQDDIEQTEYEKLISDTEKLLDKFESEYEEWLTNLVVELETTLEMAIEETNQYSDQILTTLNDQAYGVGYTLSETTTAVFSSIGDAVSVYGNGFLDAANGINNSIGLVISEVESIYNAVEALTIANQAIAQAQSMIATAMSAKSSGSSSSSSSTTTSSSGSGSQTESTTSSSIGVGSVMTLKDGSKYWETSWGNGDYGTKYAGVQGGVVIDSMSIASEVDGGENNPSAYGDYYVHIASADGQYKDLGWVRWEDLSAYGKGTKYTNEDLAWTQEDGGELIRRSDGAVLTPVKGATVFSSTMTDKLWDFANNPSDFLSNLESTSKVGNAQLIQTGNSVNMDMGDFNVTVVANNPTEFASQMKQVMASDKNAQKMIQEITLGQSLGKNSLNVNMYK